MARTTPAEVKRIIDTDLTDDDVNAYISGATEIVTSILGTDTTISDELKCNIEMWLAAHLIASTREQQIQSAGAGGAKVTYQGQTGIGLNATLYGQQVLVMDTTGKMAAALSKQKASITAITSFG
jgi:hypothetical protein